jgi:hypothetical protein
MTPPAALRDHVKTLAERIGERHGWRPEALKRANVADTLSGFGDEARRQAVLAVRRRLFNLDVESPGTARADGVQPIVSSDSIAPMRSPRARAAATSSGWWPTRGRPASCASSWRRRHAGQDHDALARVVDGLHGATGARGGAAVISQSTSSAVSVRVGPLPGTILNAEGDRAPC